jgi:tetratricopeptide (TPR) repeat protein
VGAIRAGTVGAARPDVEQLASLRDVLARSKQDYWAEQVEIQRRAAVAWVALAEGRKDEAMQGMRAAADLEDDSEKHVAMENRLWPMRELLGELLLELNRPADALKEFEASLQVSRNRFRSLSGAARAAELAGDRDKARTYYERLVDVGGHADADRAELRQAKAFLSRR